MNPEKLKISKEYETLHRRLWGWLAKTGEQFKYRWPEWESNGGKIKGVLHHCFCCELGHFEENWNQYPPCKCPIKWGKRDTSREHVECQSYNNLYTKWLSTYNMKQRKILAKQIANLPWRHRNDIVIPYDMK